MFIFQCIAFHSVVLDLFQGIRIHSITAWRLSILRGEERIAQAINSQHDRNVFISNNKDKPRVIINYN